MDRFHIVYMIDNLYEVFISLNEETKAIEIAKSLSKLFRVKTFLVQFKDYNPVTNTATVKHFSNEKA